MHINKSWSCYEAYGLHSVMSFISNSEKCSWSWLCWKTRTDKLENCQYTCLYVKLNYGVTFFVWVSSFFLPKDHVPVRCTECAHWNAKDTLDETPLLQILRWWSLLQTPVISWYLWEYMLVYGPKLWRAVSSSLVSMFW